MKYRDYIMFITADGCSRIVQAGANWNTPPTIAFPLMFTPKIMDWVNEDQNSVPIIRSRNFRLHSEEILEDSETRIFTYREAE